MNEHNQITYTHSTSLSDIVQPSPLRRHLAIFTLIAYIGQPLVATAEIIASQGAAANNRPTVDATANGLPLVQIATPSAAGVSHNQYTTFNVDPAGVILNNAQNTALTQQAGYVTANPNLVNGSARVILNEVTSTNRSQLNGYTEVAGQQAEVIIANPNGITCNGCGFINTSRGVLTTGTPVIGAGGSLDAFRVTSGDIQIGTAGLNGSNLTQLDLITRSVQVNGELWANNLNVITGSNQVDYTNLGVQIIQGQGTAPTVSIDVAQLGGMYANKIRLIGTEAGVGVNSAGTLAAQAGDFTLDTQGQITLTGKTTATANLSLNSATDINNSGTLYAQQNATVTGTGSISNSGLLTAQGNLALNAATLNSTGTLGAGIDANGNATQAGDLTIITQGQTIATGNNIAGRDINITATDINLANSSTQAANNLSLIASAGNIDLGSAQTQAIAGNLTATASGTLNNSAGNLEAGSGITFTANSLNNAGGSIKNLGSTRALNITTTQDIINTALNSVSGFIGSNGNLTLSTAVLNNSSGKLYAFGDLTFDQASATLDNSAGEITSNGNTILNLASINNQGGTVLAGQNTTLTTHTANGYSGLGTVAAYGNNSITLQGDYTHAAGNVFAANGNMTLTTTGNFINTTTLEAGGTLTVDAANIDNRSGALINANASVLTTTGDITNAGRIEGNSVETHSNNFTNNATVMGNTLDLYSNNLTNQTTAAFIGATQTVNLIIANTLVNLDGAFIYSLGDVNIGSSKTIAPATDTVTGNAVSVTNSSATIEADNDLRISADTITNQRTVVGVEWGPAWTEVVTGTSGYGGQGTPSYTATKMDQRFTANTTSEGQLYSGRNTRLSGAALNNIYSAVIAGGALTTTNQMTVNNTGDPFVRRETRSGQYNDYVWTVVGETCAYRDPFGGKGGCSLIYNWILVPIPYTFGPSDSPVPNSKNVSYDPNTPPPSANKTVSVQAAGTVASVNATTLDAAASPITLPTSGLYTIHSQPGQQYLVVTDPRFTNYQTFISSDYMLSRLSLDPTLMQKRLGDGFYEQKLVNEQIMQQTGQRFLGQYATANEQYAALLDAGVTAAQDLQLVPGITLTAQQIQSLKQDIVWMEDRTVTLSDGSIEHVLAPQLYLSQLSKADLSPGGSIIAANDIRIMGADSITNTGRIQGRNSNVLQANNITNTNGTIGSQGLTLLSAKNDIINLSGKINGNDVSLSAGRDIINQRASSTFTTTKTTTGQTSSSLFGRIAGPSVTDTISGTALGLEAGITATNNLSMSSGRDLSIIGATIASGGNTSIAATRDLNVGVVTVNQSASTSRYAASRSSVTQLGSSIATGGSLNLSSGNNMSLTAAALDVGTDVTLVSGGNLTVASAKNSTRSSFDTGIIQQRNYDETVIGSSINAGGNINLLASTSGKEKEGRTAGGNITLQSASLSSANGNLNVTAANDVNIGTTDEQHESFTQTRISESGFFSNKTTTTRTSSSETLAVGSALDGDSVNIRAGHRNDSDQEHAGEGREEGANKTGNLNVTGSSIVGTTAVSLEAGNDINILAATSSQTSSSYSHVAESGFLSNGGLSFTIGKRDTTDQATNSATLQSQNRSLVGSTNGNLTLKAGGNAIVSGSDILAANDINVAARDITINSGLDQTIAQQSHDVKQSGLTVAITSNVTDTANTIDQMKKAGSQSNSPRIKALAAAAAALAASNAASQGANISVSATVGSSESHSDRTQTSRQSSGSQINAGGNLSLVATAEKGEEGREKDKSQGGNLTIQGSDIKAGKDINLEADNKINLLAAQNTADQVSHNSSKSSGTGVGITVGTGGIVGGLNANAAMARGNVDGTDTTNTHTRVNAGNQLTLKSGGDTNLIGATAKGKQISANIGGDLNIQSVQDTSTYQSSQQSASGNATVGVGTVASASGNLNQISINGDYASVTEQSGLMAGDGGFQVNVRGNTDLKGAVIESTDVAVQNNRNTFSTATLTTSDIRNQADYEAQSISVSGGTGGMGAPLALTAGDNDASATRSGISGATVSITNTDKQKQLTGQDTEQTIASLNRDVATDKDTSGAISNNLNVQEIQTGFAVTQAFVQQANTYVANQAQKSERLKAAGEQKQKEANQETDPARKQQLQAEAQSLNQQAQDSAAESAQWGAGGTYGRIATALTAAAGGNVTGGAGQLIQGAAVNYIQSLGATEVKKIADSLDSESARAALHGILACGGGAAQGTDCGSAALGASAGSVINSLMAGDPSKMTAAEKESRKNLVATLVTGIAVTAGADNIAAATGSAVIETENNYLSPHQAVIRNQAKAACDANPSNKEACGTKTALDDLDKATKRQMDSLVSACKSKIAGACDAVQTVIKDRDSLAAAQILTCPAPYDCAGSYRPSAQENASAATILPGWGSGEATPTADPITAYVMLRFGLRTPVVSGIGAAGGAGGEIANQLVYSDTVNNYEKIAYNAIAAWATGPVAANLNGLLPLATLGGATNASVTAYNNSQQGSNDSVWASAGFGALGGGVGMGVGAAAGQVSSRVLTTNITSPIHNPALGVLLTGPSVVRVPNQEAAAVMNMFGGTTGQAGVAAAAPPVTSGSSQ